MSNTFDLVKAIPLGVVSLTTLDGFDEIGDQGGVHLPIPIKFYDDIDTVFHRCAITGNYRPANALVSVVKDNPHPRVTAHFLHQLAGQFGAGVIDDVDRPNLGANGGNDPQN